MLVAAAMLGYLSKLNKRMTFKGFPSSDPLLIAVVKAEQALHELNVTTHYLACGQQPQDAAIDLRAKPLEF